MANPKHLELLRGRDRRDWIAWRAKEPTIAPDLSGGDLGNATLFEENLSGANLSGASLVMAGLIMADLSGADLSGADLSLANLSHADLGGANLSGANLNSAVLVGANLAGADLTGCRVYGVSAWNVKLSKDTKQQDLVITDRGESDVTVDNIEVAQFVHLLLHNEKIRDVIDTVGKKGVLLLGRFTEGRIAVLERLRDELRKRGYLPIVFNFDKPETKDFTETVRLLAGLSKFVIADLTSPKSAPYELGAIVSQTMIPFQPIIEAGETPFSMLQDLLTSYPDRVFQPIQYPSVDRLVETMDAEIIEPAETRSDELVMRRAETLKLSLTRSTRRPPPSADVNVDALPETLTVPEAGQRLRCGSCGAKTISTRPAWHTGSHRPGTPDYQRERPPMS